MKLLPRSVTVSGLLLAVAAVVIDPANVPWLTQLLGAAATTKVAAVGALIAAMGRALVPPAVPETPAP
jgi:hypothetical protein